MTYHGISMLSSVYQGLISSQVPCGGLGLWSVSVLKSFSCPVTLKSTDLTQTWNGCVNCVWLPNIIRWSWKYEAIAVSRSSKCWHFIIQYGKVTSVPTPNLIRSLEILGSNPVSNGRHTFSKFVLFKSLNFITVKKFLTVFGFVLLCFWPTRFTWF
jgi:hypothetical protein